MLLLLFLLLFAFIWMCMCVCVNLFGNAHVYSAHSFLELICEKLYGNHEIYVSFLFFLNKLQDEYETRNARNKYSIYAHIWSRWRKEIHIPEYLRFSVQASREKRSANHVYIHTYECMLSLSLIEASWVYYVYVSTAAQQRYCSNICNTLKAYHVSVCNDERYHCVEFVVIVVFNFFFWHRHRHRRCRRRLHRRQLLYYTLLMHMYMYSLLDCISYTGRVCAQNFLHKHAILKCSV